MPLVNGLFPPIIGYSHLIPDIALVPSVLARYNMPKQQYLSRDDKGWKLRRRVPDKLQKLIGKTQWVERISGISFREACEKAKTFGVKTDAEIRRFEAALKNSSPQKIEAPGSDEPGFKFDLTDHEIIQIATAYFHELEQAIQKKGGYRKGVTDSNRNDILIELSEAYEEADAIDVGDESRDRRHPDRNVETAFHLTALQQLIKYNFLARDDFEETYQRKRGRTSKLVTRFKVSKDLRCNPQFQRLADRLAAANAEIARRKLEAVAEHRYPSLQNPAFSPALEPNAQIQPHKEIRIQQLTETYLRQRKQQVGKSRYDQLLTACRALKEEIGSNYPVSKITREQCQALADLFVIIPPYATRHYKNLGLRRAAEKHAIKNGAPAQRYKEADKNLAVLREIFEFAIDRDWITTNPVQRVKILKPARPSSFTEHEEGYEPFTADELSTIFHQPLYTGCQDDEYGVNKPGLARPRRSRFWVPLISAFSGLRMQEILQLERSDIREIDGIYYFDVNDRPTGTDYVQGEYVKRLKTRNSLRKVPIHPELIKIGILDYAENAEREWLFPDMPKGDAPKMSDQFSKKFRTFLKPAGIWAPRRKVFHSFRNAFNDALRTADVRLEYREQIMGWVDYKKMDNRYGHGHVIKKLHDEVSRVKYEALQLSHLHIEIA